MKNKYENLFPFHRIPAHSKILIYGAGDLGQEYLKQIFLLEYCEVVGMIDRAHEKYSFLKVPVYPFSEVIDLEFDYVVIALKSKKYLDSVSWQFMELGIDREKIIHTGLYEEFPNIMAECSLNKIEETSFGDEITLAFNVYRCGYGDAIISKSVVEHLMALSLKLRVDLYSTGKTAAYLPVIYEKSERIRIFSPQNTTIDYEDAKDNYMLAIQWENLLRMDVFRKELVSAIDPEFSQKMEELEREIIKYQNVTLFELMARAKYMGRNVYTSLYYQDVLGILDMTVDIPEHFDTSDMKDQLRLPIKYITIDASNEDGNLKAPKLWPRKYMEKFIHMFHSRYPEIEIVQIGAGDVLSLPGTYQMIGLDFEIVKYILKNAVFHLGPEGGTVHLASQLGTKCVVPFGSTPIWYYGYPNNINISANVCDPCYCLVENAFICVRDMDEPECMYAITPEMVMTHVEEYLYEIGFRGKD